MKLKFYLRGLGVGVLVTTLILTVAFKFKDNPTTIMESPSTVALGLNSSNTETKAVSTEKSSENSEQTTIPLRETTAETKAEVATEVPVEPATEKVTEATTPPKAEETNQSITVVLSNISNSENAAQAIENAGVIDNWIDFNKYLESSGYAVKIHNGTYKLSKGQNYESIAKIITGN